MNNELAKYDETAAITKDNEAIEEHEKQIRTLELQCEYLRQLADKAYAERNKVVAALANVSVKLRLPVLIGTHEMVEGEPWDEEWKNVLYIKTPAGQISWHFHKSEMHLIEHHVHTEVKFDGHTTEQKYDRLARAFK